MPGARLLILLTLVLGCQDAAAPNRPAAPPLPPGLSGAEAGVRNDVETRHRALVEGLEAADLGPTGLARRFGDLGISLYAHGFYPQAAEVFEQASDLAPEEFEWPYMLGHARRQRGELAAAAEAFGRALHLDALNLPARLWLAEVEMMRERLAEAEAAFEAARDQAPHCGQAWTGLGRIALSRRRHALAEELLRQALEYQPESPPARYALAMALRGSGRVDEARRELDRLRGQDHSRIITCFEDPLIQRAKRRQTGSRAHEARALRARQAGRLETALVELAAAVRANPNRFPARYDMAYILYLLRRPDDARAELESLLSERPTYAAALALLARIELEQGDGAAAAALVERALAADPWSEESHLVRAGLLRHQGRNAEAALAYERAAALAPGLVPAIAGRAAALFELGRVDEALDYLERQVDTYPTKTQIAVLRAHFLLAGGSPDAPSVARALAEAAMEREPSIGAAETVALALAHGGDFAAAGRWQSRVLAAMPAGQGWARERQRAESRLQAFRQGRRVAAEIDLDTLSSVMLAQPLTGLDSGVAPGAR